MTSQEFINLLGLVYKSTFPLEICLEDKDRLIRYYRKIRGCLREGNEINKITTDSLIFCLSSEKVKKIEIFESSASIFFKRYGETQALKVLASLQRIKNDGKKEKKKRIDETSSFHILTL